METAGVCIIHAQCEEGVCATREQESRSSVRIRSSANMLGDHHRCRRAHGTRSFLLHTARDFCVNLLRICLEITNLVRATLEHFISVVASRSSCAPQPGRCHHHTRRCAHPHRDGKSPCHHGDNGSTAPQNGNEDDSRALEIIAALEVAIASNPSLKESVTRLLQDMGAPTGEKRRRDSGSEAESRSNSIINVVDDLDLE